MFSSISRGVLRKSKGGARIELNQSALQSIGEEYHTRNEPSSLGSAEPVSPNFGPPSNTGYEMASTSGRSRGSNKGGRSSSSTGGRKSGSGSRSPTPQILSIGGGKGGIGKSFVSTNVAICLAKQGHSVALVDLDLGAANLHTCLGVPSPKIGIFDFVNSQVDNIESIAVETRVKGLKLYGGGQEFWQQIRPQSGQKVRLISKLQQIQSDYVILDLGAGTHVNTLDFFIFSHAGLLVVVPEPTSIENAYVFLKSVMFRKLQSIIKALREEEACQDLLNSLGDPKNSSPPFSQLESFATKNPAVGNRIIQLIRLTKIGIAMNQVRTKSDNDIGHSMAKISERYFGFSATFLGVSHYDDEAWKSVRNRKPVCLDRPKSISARDLTSLSESIQKDLLEGPQNRNHSQVGS